MLGIGFTEMIIIAAIALVVIGPEKFPDFAKVVVRTLRDLRGYVDDVKKELGDELKPIKREVDSVNRMTRYDSESYLRSLTEDKPKPPVYPASDPAASGASPADAPPGAGDFGYDESLDDRPNSAEPVGYGAYPDGEGAAAAETEAPADAGETRPQGDDFDVVRQPDRLD